MSAMSYCKVCHDAGKEESVYTSHFIRETKDPNSKIVCPTLLSLQCRFCSNQGHTVKYCKEIKKKQQEKDKKEKQAKQQLKIIIPHPPSPVLYSCPSNNMFNVLDDDSDQEDDDLPPLVSVNERLPPLVSVYERLPPLVSANDRLPTLVSIDDLIPPVSMPPPPLPLEPSEMQIAPTLSHKFTPRTPPTTPPALSYKNIIKITREQVLKDELQKCEELKRKEEEKIRKEELKKREESKKKIELASPPTPSCFGMYKRTGPLNWADDESSDEEDLICVSA
jgi:hypothetical protein